MCLLRVCPCLAVVAGFTPRVCTDAVPKIKYEMPWVNMLNQRTAWHLLFSLKQNGKHDEGWMILKQVHDTNMRAKGYPERVFSVSISEKVNKHSYCFVQHKKTLKYTHMTHFMCFP